MPADFALLRDIIVVCYESYPLAVSYADLQKHLWTRAESEICEHVLMLERGDYVSVDRNELASPLPFDGSRPAEIIGVSLRDLEKAQQFVNPPEPERRPIGFLPSRPADEARSSGARKSSPSPREPSRGDLERTSPPPRLFEEFDRTHEGPGDTGESLYSYINRSARPAAAEARQLSEQWFGDYAKDASDSELDRFVSGFRSKGDTQHYATWFELLTHQVLVRLGFSLRIHPDLPDSNKHPDFAAISDGSRILVEATVVAPKNDPFAPSSYERDAQEKFTQLEIANFTARIASVSGTLHRRLKKKEIEREFGKLIAKHDPDIVQRRIDQFGYGAQPAEIICFGDWQLTVELLPRPPHKRAPRKARVAYWPLTEMHDASVPNARQKIRRKLRTYRPTDEPLVLAVNVHNRAGFNVRIDGHDAVFAKDGTWSPQRSASARPTAVIFFANTNSYTVGSTEACLYVNPSVSLDELPPALLRLPHVHGPDGSICVEGESIASILGLS